MRLALSSAAAPDAAGASELLAACAHRGLSGLELCITRGMSPGVLLDDAAHAPGADVSIVGVWCDASHYAHQLSYISRTTGAPVIVGGAGGLEDRAAFARSITAHGGCAMLLVSGPADGWLPAVIAAGVPFAWQVGDDTVDAGADAERILRSNAPLGYVRLVGGGPETIMQEGRGIGSMMKTLTLAGYDGPLVLTPSSPRFRMAWRTWLGRRGGSGCGSKPGPMRPLQHFPEPSRQT
jgi:hypothetical protein